MGKRAPRGGTARTKIVTVRLTPAEHARVQHRAAMAGSTVSAWAAEALSDGRVTVDVVHISRLHPALIAELKRVGNNINQIAACLNALYNVPAHEILAQMQHLLETLIRDEAVAARVARIRAARAGDPVPHPQSEAAERGLGAVRSRHGLDAAAGVDRGGPRHGSPHP